MYNRIVNFERVNSCYNIKLFPYEKIYRNYISPFSAPHILPTLIPIRAKCSSQNIKQHRYIKNSF